MSSNKVFLFFAFLIACAPPSGGTGATTGQSAGSSGASGSAGSGGANVSGGAFASGTPSSGSTGPSGATTTSGVGSGVSSGSQSAGTASGATTSGAASGSTAAASGVGASGGTSGSSAGASGSVAVALDGGVNLIPAGYTGTPFAQNTIPGTIYVANYDKGGAGVAYCHAAAGVTDPTMCQSYVKLTDWCCGKNKGCDDRTQNQGPCPVYRADDDNAGLSHMNQGEPDDYATTGPSWAAGSNGPTLTGPTVMAGTPVPQDATTTTVQDVYLSYTYTAEWLKFTVEVTEAGTYVIGGQMGVPAGTILTIDFGNGISSTLMPPASPCTWAGCPETYHSWNNLDNLGMVTFPAPGTYLMTFTITLNTINPLFFTFHK